MTWSCLNSLQFLPYVASFLKVVETGMAGVKFYFTMKVVLFVNLYHPPNPLKFSPPQKEIPSPKTVLLGMGNANPKINLWKDLEACQHPHDSHIRSLKTGLGGE